MLQFCSYIKEERVTNTNCLANNDLSSRGLLIVDSQHSIQSSKGSNSGRVFQLDSLVVKLGFFNLILQKTIILSIFSKSDPIFQDLNIFVKALKPKTYVIENVRLRGPVDHYYYQASHVAHDLI